VYHIVTRKRPREPEEPDEESVEKKERVLHTRVPESLETHLRERAEDLGISVSNLVRNVLGHAFGLVGDVVADGHAIARAARGDKAPVPVPTPATPPPASPPSIDDVLGWQPIVLGKNAVCAKCNAILPRGTDAAIGVGSSLVVCPSCLQELRA
jgi:hypothetical protein